jgi:anaerobic selenocysteine-containing dehydrogenase
VLRKKTNFESKLVTQYNLYSVRSYEACSDRIEEAPEIALSRRQDADYNRLRDKMAEALEGFECFNRRVRQPLGFRLKQPARELVFLTDTGRANFSSPPLADAAPKTGRLLLGTVRSHDQWNTTIYSDDDRYRGVKNRRTLVFMNEDDMKDRGLKKYDLVDLTSFAKDGSTRYVRSYRAIPYNLPRGSAMGYMPELNVLCPIGDYSAQSDQPLMKHLVVEIKPSRPAAA